MVRKMLALSLLAISLATPRANAQSTLARDAAVSAVDPATIQALKDMGAFLQTLIPRTCCRLRAAALSDFAI